MMEQRQTGLRRAAKGEIFWQQQFNRQGTAKQTAFDILFGIVVPILLLIYYGQSSVRLASIRAFVAAAMGLGIITLTFWLLVRQRAGIASRSIGVVFMIEAVYATVLAGLLAITGTLVATGAFASVLLEGTAERLLYIPLGCLGFVPWLTAFVYYRNGRRALAAAKTMNPLASAIAVLLGVAWIVSVPLIVEIVW